MADHFQPIIFWGADYDAWMTPKSEGGLGPDNAREIVGIEAFHHYGVTIHEAVAGTAAGEVIYGVIRSDWHKPREGGGGLHDDDHTYDYEDAKQPGGRGRVQIYKTEKAGYWPFNPYGVADGAGARWFDQEYRTPAVGELLAEAAYCETTIVSHGEELANCRDTVRGRKRAKDLRSLIKNREWTRKMVLKRWPQTADYLDTPLVSPIVGVHRTRLDAVAFAPETLARYPIVQAHLGE